MSFAELCLSTTNHRSLGRFLPRPHQFFRHTHTLCCVLDSCRVCFPEEWKQRVKLFFSSPEHFIWIICRSGQVYWDHGMEKLTRAIPIYNGRKVMGRATIAHIYFFFEYLFPRVLKLGSYSPLLFRPCLFYPVNGAVS